MKRTDELLRHMVRLSMTGHTRQEIARQLGCHPVTVSRWCSHPKCLQIAAVINNELDRAAIQAALSRLMGEPHSNGHKILEAFYGPGEPLPLHVRRRQTWRPDKIAAYERARKRERET